jgi:multiple sugar transport system ATP-binding protein
MASVSFRRIGKVFTGGVTALSDFSIDVGEGEFLVLVGPSGCGKSTCLRILAGLETPTEGRVLIGGRDVTEVDPQDRDVAMVFQNYALYPHMSVEDNMAFALRMRRTPGDETLRRVREAAAVLGITDLLGRKPRELSGGQRQRAALGRAIVRKPAVFLFDEPLSNLDAKLRVQMRSELGRLHNRLGATMIYVTHDQAEAMTLGDRIVVLKDGRVQQVAAPLDLYENPVNIFVAGFIGSPAMNIYPVRCVDGDLRFAGGQLLKLRLPMPDGDYSAGIRPEDVLPGEGPFRSPVEVVEMLGNEKIVYLGGSDSIQAVVRSSPSLDARVGQSMPFGFRMNRLLLFDAGGRRVRQDA